VKTFLKNPPPSSGQNDVPFVLLALFYLGGLWQRPMYLDEYAFAVWTGQLPCSDFLLRLPGAVATLLTAGAVRVFMKKHDRETGGMAAALFLALGIVYAAGTMAAAAPFFTLGFTVLVFSFAEWILEKEFRGIIGIALGTGLAYYAGTRMPQIPFRKEHLGLAALGLFPLLLILPVLISGCRKLNFAKTPERAAAAGALLGIGAVFFGQWTAAAPFLALLAALGLREYAAENPEMLRLDRMLRHWIKLFMVLGILLAAGFLLAKFGRIRAFLLPGNMVMTLFSFLILTVWYFMAVRDRKLPGKMTFFALGSAFFLCGLPAMVPDRVTAKQAPAEIIRRLWPKDADGVHGIAAVTPELENVLRFAGCAGKISVIPADQLHRILPPSAGAAAAVLLPAKSASGMPPAWRKIVLRGSDIAILEYRP